MAVVTSEGLCYNNVPCQGCCHFEDAMALRMIVAWMATVAIVVFVALVVEIITASHLPTLGDVVTDHPNCSDIGASILRDGGNAVDAAVGAALCLAVAAPHRAGLGGGGVMLIHQLRSNLTTVIDFQVPNITAISSISLHSLFPLLSQEVSPSKLRVQSYQDNPRIAEWGRRSVSR